MRLEIRNHFDKVIGQLGDQIDHFEIEIHQWRETLKILTEAKICGFSVVLFMPLKVVKDEKANSSVVLGE